MFIVLVSAGTLGVMQLFSTSTLHSSKGIWTEKGLGVCEQRIEQVTADRAYRGYAFVVNANYATNEVLTGLDAGYTRTTNIYEVSLNDLTTAQSNTGLKRVDVTCAWGQGPGDTVNISTLVGN